MIGESSPPRWSQGGLARATELWPPEVPDWRRLQLENLVMKAAKIAGVPAPELRVGRVVGIATTRVGWRGKPGSLHFDARLVSSAPLAVVAEVVAHEIGHLAQGWWTGAYHRLGGVIVVLLAGSTLAWGAAHGYGLFFAWVALAVSAVLAAAAMAHRRWTRRIEVSADRVALELVGTKAYLFALAWVKEYYRGSRHPAPLHTRLLHLDLSYEDRATLAHQYPLSEGSLISPSWSLYAG